MDITELEKAIGTIKIAVTDSEKEELMSGLEEFLQWLEPLKQVNTENVDPLLFAHRAINIFREDRPETANRAALEKAAPDFDEGFYRVPPIID